MQMTDAGSSRPHDTTVFTPAEESLSHQVRKKEVLAARYLDMIDAGVVPIETIGLRIDEIGARVGSEQAQIERQGTRRGLG